MIIYIWCISHVANVTSYVTFFTSLNKICMENAMLQMSAVESFARDTFITGNRDFPEAELCFLQ
jgi:hypothetical protein